MGTLFYELKIIVVFVDTYFHQNGKPRITVNVKCTVLQQFNFTYLGLSQNLEIKVPAKLTCFVVFGTIIKDFTG